MASTAQEQNAQKIEASEQNGVTQRHQYDYGGNPNLYANPTNESRLAAFGGDLQPGLYVRQSSPVPSMSIVF